MAEKFDINTEEMAKAGLQFGHRTSRVHPQMKPYIFGAKNTIHLIDLEKSAEKLREALDFIKKNYFRKKNLAFDWNQNSN